MKEGTELPLTVTFGEAHSIERPADATDLNLSDLMFLADRRDGQGRTH